MELRQFVFVFGMTTACFAGSAYGEDPVQQFSSDRVQLIGVASLPGNMADLSELTGDVAEGIPQNRFGGISAIDRIGNSSKYILASDRGPQDGQVDFHCRWHTARLAVQPGNEKPVTIELLGTHTLSDGRGHYFTGLASAIDHESGKTPIRLDPEGIRMVDDGSVWISDEYGPQVLHFDFDGRLLSTIHPSAEMRADTHAGDFLVELKENDAGRLPNRGMEGLALCDECGTLVAVLQSPLIQETEMSPSGFKTGENCRIVRMDTSGGHREQFAYHLDNHMNGLSDILALDHDRFLVIERDSTVGSESVFKKIMAVDLSKATDVSQMERLPVRALPVAIAAASKLVLIDMLDPRFGLAGTEFPEKLEGLAWGPEINGRPTLVVASDNDFEAEQDSRFFVFGL